MRTRTVTTATAFAVLFGSTALGVAVPAAAAPGALAATAGDIVVDGVHQKIFLSDPANGKIVVTDYAGTTVGTVGDLPGVAGLALSADSGKLFAAVPGAHEVVAIATDGAADSKPVRYPIGQTAAPEHLALAGGKLWFGYADNGAGNIGSLDLTPTEPVVTLDQDEAGYWQGAPLVATTAAAPTRLAVGGQHAATATLGMYDIGTNKATRTAAVDAKASATLDLAFTPDGSRLVTATAGNNHGIWAAVDLTPAGSYSTAGSANAVAIAGTGTVAAGTANGEGPDVYVFRAGETKAVRSYDLADGESLVAGAVAWDPTGRRLFAAAAGNGGALAVHELTDPTKSVSAVTVNAPAKATRAKALKVTGSVSGSLQLPAGTPLTVTRIDGESPKGKSLGKKTLDTKNAFSFTDTPLAGGPVTYRVAYAGDANHLPATGTDTVTVSKDRTTLTLATTRKVYAQGAAAPFTAHLGKTYRGRTVEIWSDPAGSDQAKRLIKKAKVNSKGDIAVKIVMRRNVAVTATYRGDTRTGTAGAKATAYAQVKISDSLKGAYRKAKVGSTTYNYFHARNNVVFGTAMTPLKGRSAILDIQANVGGGWTSGDADPVLLPLNAKGVAAVAIPAHDAPREIRFRIRASYRSGVSGDSVNAATSGAWMYFIVTA